MQESIAKTTHTLDTTCVSRERCRHACYVPFTLTECLFVLVCVCVFFVRFVSPETDAQDLHSFLQTLFRPWGFGVHYQASSRELRHKVRRLDLFVFDNNKVHFKVRWLSRKGRRTEERED